MAKNNPLFVDSTLFQGDSIGTQIELSDVVVLEGEALYIVLTNDEAEEICLAMEQVGDTDFEVFVRLVHQKKISFYFGIAKEGELLYKSENYDRIARYALIESWMPVEKLQSAPKSPESDTPAGEALVEPIKTAGEEPPQQAPAVEETMAVKTTTPILMPEDVMNITSLLTKWGFT